MIDQQTQNMIVAEFGFHAAVAAKAIGDAANHYSEPSVMCKPKLSLDGNKWCALYGDNLQDGVAGFGDSPQEAMRDFDKSWRAKLPVQEAKSHE